MHCYNDAMANSLNVKQAHNQLLTIGGMAVAFADIHRATIYPNGRHENDAEHSFHLALSATELAATYHPQLNTGLVSQFSIVHDLPEVYAGDVPSFGMAQKTKAKKEQAEHAALQRLLSELPPHTASLLKRYEQQTEPEARFVRLVDKILPVIIYSVAVNSNKEYFMQKFAIKTAQQLTSANQQYFAQLQAMFPEFDFLLLLRQLAANTHRDRFFPEK